MVKDKKIASTIVDFQKAFEKKVAETGKSSVLDKIKARAKESQEPDSPLSFLQREEIRMTLGLTQEDVFKLIEDFERENPTSHLEKEIQDLRESCEDHYEKWAAEQEKRHALEAENAELKSFIQNLKTNLGDNVAYYVLIITSITILISLVTLAK